MVQFSVKEFLAGETPREQALFCNSYHACCGPKMSVSLLDTGTTGQPLSDGLTIPGEGVPMLEGQHFGTELGTPSLLRAAVERTG